MIDKLKEIVSKAAYESQKADLYENHIEMVESAIKKINETFPGYDTEELLLRLVEEAEKNSGVVAKNLVEFKMFLIENAIQAATQATTIVALQRKQTSVAA